MGEHDRDMQTGGRAEEKHAETTETTETRVPDPAEDKRVEAETTRTTETVETSTDKV